MLKHSLTDELNPLALQKLTRYLSENVSATDSDSAMSTLFSGFSTLVWERSVTLPLPMSPLQANLTPSFVHSIATRSIRLCQYYRFDCDDGVTSHWMVNPGDDDVPDSLSAIKSLQIL